MDEKAVEAKIRLYDSHARVQQNLSTKKLLSAREGGDAYPLKKYHNAIKSGLLKYFAKDKDSLLDMCCGRGGDIHKWIECNVGKVVGLDISPLEIVEAMRRYNEARKKRKTRLEASFKHVTCLGTKVLSWNTKYDVVTCMFAIHYFFVSEESIKIFFKNVASALKPGGHFIATFPSGKKVLQTLNQKETFSSPMLYLRKHWKGTSPKEPFGQAFECAISDTVTKAENSKEVVGSHEYLVFFNVIQALAKEVNLHLEASYFDEDLNDLFQDADVASGFKHFKPPFGQTKPPFSDKSEETRYSLRLASELYVATVFKMGEETPKKEDEQGKEGEEEVSQEPDKKKQRKA